MHSDCVIGPFIESTDLLVIIISLQFHLSPLVFVFFPVCSLKHLHFHFGFIISFLVLHQCCQDVFIVSTEEIKTIFAANVPSGRHMKPLREGEKREKLLYEDIWSHVKIQIHDRDKVLASPSPVIAVLKKKRKITRKVCQESIRSYFVNAGAYSSLQWRIMTQAADVLPHHLLSAAFCCSSSTVLLEKTSHSLRCSRTCSIVSFWSIR